MRLLDYLEQIKLDCNKQIDHLHEYIDIKKKNGDYHAVADAACDARDLVVKIELIDKVVKEVKERGVFEIKPSDVAWSDMPGI